MSVEIMISRYDVRGFGNETCHQKRAVAGLGGNVDMVT